MVEVQQPLGVVLAYGAGSTSCSDSRLFLAVTMSTPITASVQGDIEINISTLMTCPDEESPSTVARTSLRCTDRAGSERDQGQRRERLEFSRVLCEHTSQLLPQ